MKQTLSNQDDIGYLFNVDILIKSRSNALALQSLIEFINKQEQIADFRIHSGIELGNIIEAMLQQTHTNSAEPIQMDLQQTTQAHNGQRTSSKPDKTDPVPSGSHQESTTKATHSTTKKTVTDSSHVADANSFNNWIESLIKENRLTRIVVNNKNGKHQSIPCRILNFDRDNNVVSIYHVDEKQVYTFRTNEIDEFLL
ncbi:hypothetical protein HUB98_25705 [Paenibacillus barcinonensis]|uniref:Uncharacterized protein n=1 Tax=Paenibacillus barcinonensis TaxID=198119 RepID=A0A2V4WJP5_PAEBA|nr:hypothetical protein [Paenibacillus barcinonensis]PYE52588.1 hypothetical protein DFQ00_101526 [Paenibacillus barcinonensis]QKS59262.1 hypothetical protein HUB98_25705 [Paenibacillus barcinonensis]